MIKTLIAIPKGCEYLEVKSIGNIIAKPVKIKNGAEIKTMYIDEASLVDESECDVDKNRVCKTDGDEYIAGMVCLCEDKPKKIDEARDMVGFRMDEDRQDDFKTLKEYLDIEYAFPTTIKLKAVYVNGKPSFDRYREGKAFIYVTHEGLVQPSIVQLTRTHDDQESFASFILEPFIGTFAFREGLHKP